MFFTAFALGALIPRPGIYLILAFDIVFAGCLVPLVMGTYWKKSTSAPNSFNRRRIDVKTDPLFHY